MKKGILLLGLVCVLSACGREPMIQLDSATQSSLEAKRQQESMAEAEVSSEISSIALVDTTQWQSLPADTVLALEHYMPTLVNQQKTFSNGNQTYTTYAAFSAENGQQLQVEEQFETSLHVKVYRQTAEAIVQTVSYEDAFLGENLLGNTQKLSVSQPRVLLQAPVMKGTKWVAYDQYESTITAIYETATLNEQRYESVVEVTTVLDAYVLKEFYAPMNGLIMTQIEPTTDELTAQQWILGANLQEVKQSTRIQVIVPEMDATQNVPTFLQIDASLNRQTDETLASAFQLLFVELGILPETATIQAIVYDATTGIVQVDFAPGIVALMNAHATREEGVIPSIVATVGNYFKVKQVKLTVSGTPLLPDRLPLPTNGVWHIQP